MFNMIIGEYFLSDGLNTTESPKVFHCTPVSPTVRLPCSQTVWCSPRPASYSNCSSVLNQQTDRLHCCWDRAITPSTHQTITPHVVVNVLISFHRHGLICKLTAGVLL